MEKEWEENDKFKNPMVQVSFDENGEERVEWLDFHSLHARTKVQILYRLCDYRLSAPDSSTFVKDAAGRLRLKPIGIDSLGYVYWYFHGRRLYKEKPRVAKILVEKLREPMKMVNGTSSPIREDATEKIEETLKSPEKESAEIEVEAETETETQEMPKAPMNDQINGFNKTMASGLKNQTTLWNWLKTTQSKPEPKSTTGIPVSILKESWTVICHDEEEWRKLIERMKQSLSLPDRELAERFKLTYLPKVAEIEAEMLKRQRAEEKARELASMPKRCSQRIASKLASQQLSADNIIENKCRSRADRARLRDLYRGACDEGATEDANDESFNPKNEGDKDSCFDEEEELEPNDEDDETEPIKYHSRRNGKNSNSPVQNIEDDEPTPSVSSASAASLSSNDKEDGSISSADSRFPRRSNRRATKPEEPPTLVKRIRVGC
ncbi:chromatin remodeling regulator CECR2-like isoform X2 [Panonychus citri]|nr:chromatin remodeling regulator CECR2-like isoform X2 [Panonychus citri]